MPNSEKYLTPAETSELLGVKVHTLAVWRSTKRYPLNFCRVGRLIRYRESDVQAFLDANHVDVSEV